MGALIAISPWLTTLAEKGRPENAVALKLMRAQIVNANRRGHHLKLSTEFLRRRIVSAARYGHVAEASAECSRCGCQAKLGDWVAAADWDAEDIAAVRADRRLSVPPEFWAYLMPCPGEEYREDIAASAALPAQRSK